MQTPIKTIHRAVREQYTLNVRKSKRFRDGVMNENILLWTDGGPFVLRINHHKTRAETALERFLLQRLEKKGFPCPVPHPTHQGTDVFLLNGASTFLYPLLPGKPLRRITTPLLWEIGALIATLHIQLRGAHGPKKKGRWDPEDIPDILARGMPKLLQSGFPDAKKFFGFVQEELCHYRFPQSLPCGYTHQDVKPENTLIHHGHVSGILDFDNCYNGILLVDLATTIMWYGRASGTWKEQHTTILRHAYESVRPLTNAESASWNDILRWRLLREMVIGPLTTLASLPLATARAHHFLKLYKKLS